MSVFRTIVYSLKEIISSVWSWARLNIESWHVLHRFGTEIMHLIGAEQLYGIDNDINGGLRSNEHGGGDSLAGGLYHHRLVWVLLEVDLAKPGLRLEVHLAAETMFICSKHEPGIRVILIQKSLIF